MSKLWIVDRHPRRREALARLSGLAEPDLVCAGPDDARFGEATAPAALLLGVGDDFELELQFLHRHRARFARSRRFLLTRPEDAAEVERLFGPAPDAVLDATPSARELRALISSAVAHRSAESLAERRDRERIAERFASWFGDLEIPGLFRALDPALERLPLLVRGVPGSGRALLARYVELFRLHLRDGARGPTLRIDARDLPDTDTLAARIRARDARERIAVRTVWVDGVDALDVSTQRALAEWIRLDAAPAEAIGRGLRWIGTAGPSGLLDRLDPDLEHAFAPLVLSVPALADAPNASELIAAFADRVAADWTRVVGGVRRRLGDSAIAALDAHAWSGDRAEVEAIIRSSLAASSRDPLEASDLVSGPESSRDSAGEGGGGSDPEEAYPAPAAPEAEDEPAIEEAVFADETDGTEGAHAVERGAAAQPRFESVTQATPVSSFEDFERAFEAGLAAPEPVEPGHPDVSEAMGLEAFRLAGGGGDDGATDGNGSPAEPHEAAAPLSAAAPSSATAAEQPATTAQPGEAAPSASAEPTTPEASSGDLAAGRARWRRLARSLSHEIRNPLVSIKTFAELLPEHFEDASFRERFTELVGRDVSHIDEVVTRLAQAAAGEMDAAAIVDVSALIERLLDERRERIAQGRLLVLRELERDDPTAWADAQSLEVALAGLLDRALAALPERGDLFVATRRIERAADGRPRLRVLLRHHNPELGSLDGSGLDEMGSAANVLEYVLAETIVEASEGTLTIDSTDAQETLILVDLRTPA